MYICILYYLITMIADRKASEIFKLIMYSSKVHNHYQFKVPGFVESLETSMKLHVNL